MFVSCTKKLADELGIKPGPIGASVPPLFSWSANLVTINRRKTAVVVNDSSRFGFVLYGLKVKDFKMLDQLILEEMKAVLLRYGIRPEAIERYMSEIPDITFVKASDRRFIARLNKACQDMAFFVEEFVKGSIPQPQICARINSAIVLGQSDDYAYPHEILFQDLAEFYGKPIFCDRAYDLTASLDLERYTAWRRLLVPAGFTFEQLHSALQLAFGWANHHLYEFYASDGAKAVRIAADEDWEDSLQPNETLLYAPETGIDSLLSKVEELEYTYDFGDNWLHQIKVNGVVDDYDKNTPTCVMGEGDSPLEDVGGVGGYLDYLDAVADTKRPDHDEAIAWGKEQWWHKPFDIDAVGHRLKQLMIGGVIRFISYW